VESAKRLAIIQPAPTEMDVGFSSRGQPDSSALYARRRAKARPREVETEWAKVEAFPNVEAHLKSLQVVSGDERNATILNKVLYQRGNQEFKFFDRSALLVGSAE
jgi:hypothetical protein